MADPYYPVSLQRKRARRAIVKCARDGVQPETRYSADDIEWAFADVPTEELDALRKLADERRAKRRLASPNHMAEMAEQQLSRAEERRESGINGVL